MQTFFKTVQTFSRPVKVLGETMKVLAPPLHPSTGTVQTFPHPLRLLRKVCRFFGTSGTTRPELSAFRQKSSAFSLHQAAFGARPSPFDAQRSMFSILHSSFCLRCSPLSHFCILHSSFCLPLCLLPSPIQRTPHPNPRLHHHMRVNLRRRNILMPQEILHRANVDSKNVQHSTFNAQLFN